MTDKCRLKMKLFLSLCIEVFKWAQRRTAKSVIVTLLAKEHDNKVHDKWRVTRNNKVHQAGAHK